MPAGQSSSHHHNYHNDHITTTPNKSDQQQHLHHTSASFQPTSPSQRTAIAIPAIHTHAVKVNVLTVGNVG